MRLRNDSGYPLNSPDLGRVIPPGPEEFESPVYITGCTRLDEPEPENQGDDDGQPAGDSNTSDDSTPGQPAARRTGRRAARTGDQA